MRKVKIIQGEYYHIYNRGNGTQNIFLEEKDKARLLFLIIHFQSPIVFRNMDRLVSNYMKYRTFNLSGDEIEKIIKKRKVELSVFAFMPNHFHLVVKEVGEKGISEYMQRVQNAYTKYFNTKHEKGGHLFQGPFKIKHVEDNNQLLHLSAYVHRNPREIKEWKDKENNYPWSSYTDYFKENRWGDLLLKEIIENQFKDKSDYDSFVKNSGTKMETESEEYEIK